MDALECIRTRMSIRKFKPEPVPKDVLSDVIGTALRSPSYKNSQPWEVAVVSGRKKEEMSELLVGLLDKGAGLEPDIPEPASWPADIGQRINAHMGARGQAMGIDLSDPALRKKAKAANFRFYGAPHGIFLYQDSSLNEWSIFDMGLFAQSLLLSAHAHGLGTVPQAFLTDYSKEIKEFLGIPHGKRLIIGISIGYPDMEDKANSYRSTRLGTSGVIRWVG
ncbi:MAG: nitroreductase [Thermodesulfovibrionales bacterium]|nr:nitroreductase [Thermodesulfovibrionales bacterium]